MKNVISLTKEDERILATAKQEYETDNRMGVAFEKTLSGRGEITVADALGILAWMIGYSPCRVGENPLQRYYNFLSQCDPEAFAATTRGALSAAREDKIAGAVMLVNQAIGIQTKNRPRIASAFLALTEP